MSGTVKQNLRGLANAGALAVLLPLPVARGQCQYDVTATLAGPDCPPFGPNPAAARGLNDLGELVGYYCVCLCESDQAFFWTLESGLTILDTLRGMTSSQAWDVCDDGSIVGTCYLSGTAGERGFVWAGDTWTILPPEGTGVHSGALAINAFGEVVGYRDPDEFTRRGFFWVNGVFTDILPVFGPRCIAYDVSDASQVVGWTGTAPVTDAHAFLWTAGTMMDLGVIPGGFTSEAHAINNHDQVVGRGRVLQDGVVLSHPFLWQGGEMVDLGTLPGFDRCAAVDINDHAAIIGTCNQVNNPNNNVPFLWQSGRMHDLQELVESAPAVDIVDVSAINNQGQIAATATIAGQSVAVLLTPRSVPGDLNHDCGVGIIDFLALLTAWGPCPGCPADLDGDGTVGIVDFLALLANWG